MLKLYFLNNLFLFFIILKCIEIMFYLTLETSKRSCLILNVKSCTIALNYFRLKTFFYIRSNIEQFIPQHSFVQQKNAFLGSNLLFFVLRVCKTNFVTCEMSFPLSGNSLRKSYSKEVVQFFLSSLTVKSKMDKIFIFISNYYSIVWLEKNAWS